MCSFGSCQMRFEFLSQFRKVRNAFECFVTQVQTHLPKTKRVWPMKINVICTVGGFADPPSASQPMQNTGEPRDLENDRLGRRDGMDIPPDIRTEGQESPQDSGETIVVGAVGSAAPWFLTGWAEGVEVDFMIDTGCQVTILGTSVFERMCF